MEAYLRKLTSGRLYSCGAFEQEAWRGDGRPGGGEDIVVLMSEGFHDLEKVPEKGLAPSGSLCVSVSVEGSQFAGLPQT